MILTFDVAVSNTELFRELGEAVRNHLIGFGYDSRVVLAPQEIQRCPDALLFICNSELLELFEPTLHQCQRRPVTFWWYLEPLPPDNLPPEAANIARRLAGCSWPQIITDPFPFTGCLFGKRQRGAKPKRNNLTTLCQKILSCQLKRNLRKMGYDCTSLSHLDLYKTTCRLEQIPAVCKQAAVDFAFSSTISRCGALRKAGVDAHFVPVGFDPLYGENRNIRRDIDVVFLGHIRSRNDRRDAIVRLVQKELGLRGYRMEVLTQDYYGSKRNDVINRSKILLHVVRMPWELPGMRLLIGAGGGALNVTTGFSGNAAPYVEGRHFIDSSPSNLVNTLLYYLQNETQRRAIADQTYEYVKSEISLGKSILRILEHYHAHSTV
ncbi:MAG: glycosyltransferase [Planctomycetaceae bacterium]|nr:glycosyltransferase [Planctomycetaceae bacterium]